MKKVLVFALALVGTGLVGTTEPLSATCWACIVESGGSYCWSASPGVYGAEDCEEGYVLDPICFISGGLCQGAVGMSGQVVPSTADNLIVSVDENVVRRSCDQAVVSGFDVPFRDDWSSIALR